MTVWINVILLLIRYGPTILNMIKELMDALKGSDDVKIVNLANKVEHVAMDFKKKRNKKELEKNLRDLIQRVKNNKL